MVWQTLTPLTRCDCYNLGGYSLVDKETRRRLVKETGTERTPLNHSIIHQHLDQTLASPLFRRAERQSRFLRFVVYRTLRSDNPLNPDPPIKEFEIGIAVYDRRDDYDPRADPIVRVEASRLRARLREHYEVTPPTEVKIDLPKGGYIPHFTFLETGEAAPAASQTATSDWPSAPTRASALAPGVLGSARSVAVQPFRSLSSDPEHQNFCEGLNDELLHKLAQQKEFRVIAQSTLDRVGAPTAASRYLIEGSVRHAGPQIRVTVHVVDRADGSTKLSNIYSCTIDDIFTAQEQVAEQIAADVAEALIR